MEGKKSFWGTIVIVISIIFMSVTWANAASVNPVLFDPWQSGDAAFECVQVDCDGDFFYKIGAPFDNGIYSTDEGNIITIYYNKSTAFYWTSEWPVCCVIVAAGTMANVFYYEAGMFGDSYLYAPINPDTNKHYEIDSVTFCYKEPYGVCYKEETAWGVGYRYVTKGNWAMYVPYEGVKITHIIRAAGGDGVGIEAGNAIFSAPDLNGRVTITINLVNGFIFYYDLADEQNDNNVKIEGYTTVPPSNNPAPGLFAYKETAPIGRTSHIITVPQYAYYGIHLDVAYPVPCE